MNQHDRTTRTGSTRGRTTARALPMTVLALVVAMISTALVAGGTAQASAPADRSAERVVSSSPRGELTSRISGETAKGDAVTGTFTPLRFIKGDGRVRVRGLLDGVVTKADGTTSTFSALRTMRVAAINGTPVRTGGAAASSAVCDVLHLRLAPLNLDLLGLKVHLDRVILDIVAQSGAGNLLGNLLCAVTGLLDGGLDGLLGRLTNLLNDILGALRLGV